MSHKFEPGNKHKLDNEWRRQNLPPFETLEDLGLDESDVVADIGCGIGYFSIPAAEIIKDTNKVYALDTSEDMLLEVEKRASIADGMVKAKATAKSVFNSDKMTDEESVALVNENQTKLNLTGAQFKRWAGKRYLILIEIKDVTDIEPFEIDKSNYGNMDDWLPVKDINSVKII